MIESGVVIGVLAIETGAKQVLMNRDEVRG